MFVDITHFYILAMGKSYDYPNASESTLKNIYE